MSERSSSQRGLSSHVFPPVTGIHSFGPAAAPLRKGEMKIRVEFGSSLATNAIHRSSGEIRG